MVDAEDEHDKWPYKTRPKKRRWNEDTTYYSCRLGNVHRIDNKLQAHSLYGWLLAVVAMAYAG